MFQIMLQGHNLTPLDEAATKEEAEYKIAKYLLLFLARRTTGLGMDKEPQHIIDWLNEAPKGTYDELINAPTGYHLINIHHGNYPPSIVREKDYWELLDPSQSIPQIYHIYYTPKEIQ